MPKSKNEPKVSATPEQVHVAQARLRRAAERAGLFGEFPKFKLAVDNLPDVAAAKELPTELRVPILDALFTAGAKVDLAVWKMLGVEQFARK